jgi:hypothetical protein
VPFLCKKVFPLSGKTKGKGKGGCLKGPKKPKRESKKK